MDLNVVTGDVLPGDLLWLEQAFLGLLGMVVSLLTIQLSGTY